MLSWYPKSYHNYFIFAYTVLRVKILPTLLMRLLDWQEPLCQMLSFMSIEIDEHSDK